MNEPWVLPPPDNLVGSIAMKAFRACRLDYPRTIVFSDSPHVRMSLLATGRFLSVFPVSAVRFPAPRLEVRVLPVELPLVRVPVGIVTLKNRPPGPVTQLFIEHSREVARPLTKRK
jgi:DNA-binding transcriptional LysR family regulator